MFRMILAVIALIFASSSAHADCFPKFGTDGDDVLAVNTECVTGQKLIGLGGSDILTGWTGDDVLWGDACTADKTGGDCKSGADVMTGGDGDDAFAFNAAKESRPDRADTIEDFTQGHDVIAMAGVCFHAGVECSFVGTAAFDGAPGEVRYRVVHPPQGPTVTIVDADLNGDGTSDFEIDIMGEVYLGAADFLFDTYPPL